MRTQSETCGRCRSAGFAFVWRQASRAPSRDLPTDTLPFRGRGAVSRAWGSNRVYLAAVDGEPLQRPRVSCPDSAAARPGALSIPRADPYRPEGSAERLPRPEADPA